MGLLGPSMVGRGTNGITLTQLDFKSGGASQTGVNFGTPSATRLILVAGAYLETGSGSSIITAITIGGLAATLIRAANVNNDCIALGYRLVPTGTSGTVTISAGSGSVFGMSVCSLDGYTSATPSDTAFANSASASNANMVMDLPRSSMAIYALMTAALPTFPNATIDDSSIFVGTTRITFAHKLNGPNALTADSENATFGTGRAAYACGVWS